MKGTNGQVLVGDIGGTRARFGLVGPEGELSRGRALECSKYPSLVDAARAYLSEIPSARPVRGAIAVACPVLEDQVQMTNHDWSFSVGEARERLGLEVLEALNDFTALALALPLLGEGDTRILSEGSEEPGAPLAVLGPGTGLGVSALLQAGERWIPLATEGGHREFAPMSERDWRVAEKLRARFGRVSLERVLSGPGLVNLYEAICAVDGRDPEALTPEEVVKGASESCEVCREATAIFSHHVGTVASDLALTFGARGGVFVGGGVVPRMGEVFDDDLFRQGYLNKGRFRWYLEQIPARLIVNPKASLVGAGRALASPVPAGVRDQASA